MPSPIQAGSLADVMNLAENPPRNPHNRVLPDDQQPLVLYIARVPGNKDVFLTTMKPQEKVVTAQDVQNSLYYLHVTSPNDYQLLQDQDHNEELPEEPYNTDPGSGGNVGIYRRPLPNKLDFAPRSQSSYPPSADLHLQAHIHGLDRATQVSRKPVDHGVRPGHRSFDSAPSLPARKLLGPRSMNQCLHSAETSALHEVPERRNVDMRRWSEQPAIKPQLPPRPSPVLENDMHVSLGGQGRHSEQNALRERMNSGSHGFPAEHCWEWENPWETRRTSEARAKIAEVTSSWQDSHISLQETSSPAQDASLTLIRRYDGEQSNVANIWGTESAYQTNATSDTNAGILIDILTPGYSTFVSPNDRKEGAPHNQTSKETTDLDKKEKGAFRRQLQLSKGTKRPRHPHDPESSELFLPTEKARPSFESRQASSDSFRSPRTEPSTNKPVSSRGYTIETPWTGFCEFTTGLAGRSLKCKHFYKTMNPTFGPGVSSAPVSELRFNLPSSNAIGTPTLKSSDSGIPRERKRSSLFLRSHHRRGSSFFETDSINSDGSIGGKVELEDRLDLSLGQEHAGGGFGGKQAKLGKLIVEVEGLQMLDLVVAANMALWWKVYERTT